MGREEEIAYAREHGIPVKGGTEIAALLDRRQPLGALLGGGRDRGPRRSRRPTTSSSSSRRPRRRPTSRSWSRSASSAGCPVSLDGEELGLVELIDRVAEIGAPPRGRHRRPHRGPDRRAQGPRPLRGAGRGDHPRPPTGSSRSSSRRSTRTTSSRTLDEPLGLPLLRGALARAAARGPRRLHGVGRTSTSPAR